MAGDETAPASVWVDPDSVFNDLRHEGDTGSVGSVSGEMPVDMRKFCVEREQAGDRMVAKQVSRLLLGGARLEGDEVAGSMVILVALQAAVIVGGVWYCSGSSGGVAVGVGGEG